MKKITWRVPATSANLGPGFDCLGLALNLYNQTCFTLEGSGFSVEIHGEGENLLPLDEENLILKAFFYLYEQAGARLPRGVRVISTNAIPVSSGMGSSASAVLAGLLGANSLLDGVFSKAELLTFAAALEGHPDNVAPALLGGLVASVQKGERVFARTLPIAAWETILVTPEVSWSTQEARSALPKQVSLTDAVFNIGRTMLLTQALADGDLPLLREIMDDRLHQAYRLDKIKGAKASLNAARNLGAGAAISGAGPSLIAFAEKERLEAVEAALLSGFKQARVIARARRLHPDFEGCLAI